MTVLNNNNFKSEVLDFNGLTLVDFWAPRCGPCRMLAPILEEIANEYSDKIKFTKIDVDENQNIGSEHQIANIPTLILFENGKEINRHVGFINKENLLDFLGL